MGRIIFMIGDLAPPNSVKEMEAEILEARIQELASKRGKQLMISEYKAVVDFSTNP